MVMQGIDLSRIEQFVALHYRPLFHFAERLCGNPAEAMVMTQRTFRLASDFSRTLPVPANFRAWLFAILFHRFLEGRPRSDGA